MLFKLRTVLNILGLHFMYIIVTGAGLQGNVIVRNHTCNLIPDIFIVFLKSRHNQLRLHKWCHRYWHNNCHKNLIVH